MRTSTIISETLRSAQGITTVCYLYKFDPPRGKGDHSEQQESMLPARDIGGAVGAVTVADGQVDDLAVQFGRAEDQVKITEGIEISKVGAIGGDLFVILAPHDLCSAECVLDGLS